MRFVYIIIKDLRSIPALVEVQFEAALIKFVSDLLQAAFSGYSSESCTKNNNKNVDINFSAQGTFRTLNTHLHPRPY